MMHAVMMAKDRKKCRRFVANPKGPCYIKKKEDQCNYLLAYGFECNPP